MTYQGDNFYIGQVVNGNSAAYKMLVERHKDMVFSIVIKIVRDRQEAEEVAQDVFIKAYQALARFEGKSKFSTWLYRIAYNAAISRERKQKTGFTAIDESLIDNYTVDSVSEQMEAHSREEQIEALTAVMEKLPEDDNLLLNLFYRKDCPVEEISEITGLSVSNVKVKLYRIRKRMYEELKQLIEP